MNHKTVCVCVLFGFYIICHIMTMSDNNRELNADFYSAASMKYYPQPFGMILGLEIIILHWGNQF